MASSKNSKAKQFNIKNNDRRYIIEKYSSDIYSKYTPYNSNKNRDYDDYYILHSLKNIVNKINTLKNNDIKVLLVSMNSGKPAQLDKGKYKYIEIEFDKRLNYKEVESDYTDDIYFFLDENKICFFEIGVFLELYNNLKSYEQFSYTYIYKIINKIISPYKLIYDNYRFLNNKERNYKDIIEDIKNNNFELIIKEREIDRLKKVMQEYFDNNKNTVSILPSYRLYKEDKKKDTRYYTLESLIVLDEILRIYKDIKSTEFVFIRNISYLYDAEDIAKEIFNFDKILKSNIYTIESEKYIKEILFNISDDKKRQKEIKKIDIKNILNNFETIKIKDLENSIFYLYDTILNLIRDNNNYNIKEDEQLQNGILYYDNVFHYLQYFIGYLFTDKKIINEEEYKKIIALYIYKYNTLRNHNTYRFYKFYLNNETAKKHNIKDYGIIDYNIYIYYDEEKIIKKYSIYDYKEIYIYYYKFILMSIAYEIIKYNLDVKNYLKAKRKYEIEHKEEKKEEIIEYNITPSYEYDFNKIKKHINTFNNIINNLYFINIINYEKYKKYDCCKLEKLINDAINLIKDEKTFIDSDIEEEIKVFEEYKLIEKEAEKIKNTINKIKKIFEYMCKNNMIDKNINKRWTKWVQFYTLSETELLIFITNKIKNKFSDIEENIKEFEGFKLIKKEIELNNNKIGLINNKPEYINNSEDILNKFFYSFLEEEYKLSYDNTEDIIKKINNFYNIYKSIEIPIKNI
ncbi:hypothetical protein [uncultured Brachyspira sp.]|uniref:hypothetical protein n=1 Tax=uncultured Brachyspira sp. TaxID=221953 RepID=UPI00261F8E81|nr:hypothetical protein [uncultured Brachyspira sp.]